MASPSPKSGESDWYQTVHNAAAKMCKQLNRRRRCSCSSSVCSLLVSAEAATLAGSFDGEGGARNVDVRGFGAEDLAGE